MKSKETEYRHTTIINSIKAHQILVAKSNEEMNQSGDMLIQYLIESIESGDVDFKLFEAARMMMDVTLIFSVEDSQKNDFLIQHALQNVVFEGQRKFKLKNPWVLNCSSDRKYFILSDVNK